MKKGIAILLFFVGIVFILYGLSLEVAKNNISLPSGKLAAVFMMAVVLVFIWVGLHWLDKATRKSESGAVRGFTNLVYGIGFFVTLLILGTMIFFIAQYAKENDSDHPQVSTTSGSTSRASSSSSNSSAKPSRNSQSYPNAVTSFYIMFEQDDSGNKRRDWSRSGDVWTERYADGRSHEFRLVGRSFVGSCQGSIAQKADGSQVFIPDKDCDDMSLWYRYQTKNWVSIGQMQNIR